MVPRVLHEHIGPQQHVAIKASPGASPRPVDAKRRSSSEFANRVPDQGARAWPPLDGKTAVGRAQKSGLAGSWMGDVNFA